MRTKPLVGCALIGLAACLSGQAAESSYTLNLLPGFNAVANPLDVGGNTLDELYPVMPDGAACYKFDSATQNYLAPAQYLAGWGWLFETFEAAVLRPGEGAFLLVNQSWNVTITGQPHVFQQRPDVNRQFNFVGCQRLGDCGFADVFGFGPQVGDEVYMFDQPFATGGTSNIQQNASSIHRFQAAGWDSVPVFKQGRAAFVFLADAPHITRQPINRSVPLGSGVTFDVQVAGAEPLFYQWRFGSALLAGRTNRSLFLPNVQLTNGGGYSVIVTNAFGATTSTVAILRVLTAPAIAGQPTNLTVIEGATAQFTVQAAGSPPLRYTWFHNGVVLSNALPGRAVLALSNAQPAQAGMYMVEVSNALGTATSEAALLTVIERPRILEPPQAVVVSPGEDAFFQVLASGTPPLSYFWRRNGVVIPGATNAQLYLARVQPQDSGDYSVTVVNAAGAASSLPVPLTVVVPQLPMADAFADRLVLAEPSGVGRGNNRGATLEPGEPLHHGKPGGHSVWLAWVAPASGVATFRSSGSTFDTLLAVYAGMELSKLAELDSDDDRGGFLGSEVRFNAVAGVMYQIAVAGFNGQEGDIVLSWFLDPSQDPVPVILVQPRTVVIAPSNNVQFSVVATGAVLRYQWFFDESPLPGQIEPVLNVFNAQRTNAGAYVVRVFQGNSFKDSRPAFLQFGFGDPGTPTPTNLAADKLADAVSSGQPLPPPVRLASVVVGYAGTQIFSTYGAVSEPGEPVHCGVVGGASVWYSYTAPTDGSVYVNTDGSDFDTLLAIYTGPGTSYSTLVGVACDNDSGRDGRTSKLSFPATAGTTYLIVVDGVRGASGWVNLSYRLLVPMVLGRVAGTNNTFRFRVTATPDYPVTIQRSQNLSNWTSVLTTNTATGNFTFFETNITPRAQRFFRAVQTP